MISFLKYNFVLWRKTKILNLILMSLIVLILSIQFAAQASIVSEHPEKPFLSSVPVLFLAPSSDYKHKESSLTLHPERGSSIAFLKPNKFQYTYKIQPDPSAPVLIVAPGMGGEAGGNTTLYISELAYRNGYTVITLTSSTHWSFALAVSSSGRAGHLPADSKDLYQAIKVIKTRLEKKFQITPSAWSLLGTSYGALDSSFLFAQDLDEKVFQFQSLILINPPLSRSTATSKSDQYFEQGQQWTAEKQKFLQFDFFHRSQLIKLHFGSLKTYEDLESTFPMTEIELSWLLGKSFRDIVLNSAYVSNLLSNIETSSYEEAFQGSITNYIRESLYKKYYDAQTEDDYLKLEQQSSLSYALSKNNSEILNTKKVVLFHSTNDYLSFPEHHSVLDELNVEKHIYPFGGHVGMIVDDAIVKDLESTLLRLKN